MSTVAQIKETTAKESGQGSGAKLPDIPPKRYFTIGEVAALCEVKSHVLRYWEEEFSQLSPVRRSNRRYYKREDVLLIREIRQLLYAQGYTIGGARKQLSSVAPAVETSTAQNIVRELIDEVEELCQALG